MRYKLKQTLGFDQRKKLRALERQLERFARSRSGKPPPQVLVRAPGLVIEHGELNMPFHSASVGKVMTATLIARLAEDGRMDFDTPIGRLLPVADIDGLPAKAGVNVSRDITVDHLLTHTSGLPDFLLPPRGHRTRCSIRGMVTHPDEVWTPTSLLDEVRRLPSIGRPGERFLYSDTAYVLLGRIAEEVTGERLADLLRSRIFVPSGMEHSSTPYDHTEMPDGPLDLDIAPFWIGGHELSHGRSMSLDWAGGGIVAPAEDFVLFQRALHGGQLITRAALEYLLRPRNRRRPGLHYGAGVVTIRFEEFLPVFRGLPRPVGGIGATSTHMFYYPEQDAHVVLNFHSTSPWEMNRSFFTHIRLARIIACL